MEKSYEQFVGIDELARYLGDISPKTIYKWSSESGTGGFPCYKVGRYLRFKISEVNEWLRDRASDGARRLHRRRSLGMGSTTQRKASLVKR